MDETALLTPKKQTTQEYEDWKQSHVCTINFCGSAGAMEPIGTLTLFQRSLDHRIRYKYLISDGDSKTFSLLRNEDVYGAEGDDQVAKLHCIGHGTETSRNFSTEFKSTISRSEIIRRKEHRGSWEIASYSLINSLQNYYGSAIRQSISKMVKSVKATLLHSNSADETPRHHLCPTGANSRSKWQAVQALGEEYRHHKAPIPEAIVRLLKPIYDQLGSPSLLEKNASMAIHNI